MDNAKAIQSIAAAGATLGRSIEKHVDLAFRALAVSPAAVKNDRFLLLVTGEAHPFGNFAIVSDPADEEAAREVAAPLASCGRPAAMTFPGPAAESVVALVRGQGFTQEHPMPAMAVEIDQLAATKLPAGYELVRVDERIATATWASAFAEGYELPLGVAQAFTPATQRLDKSPAAKVQLFAILKAGRPVCTSALYLADGLAGVYCVATLPTERGKGLGAHATAEPLRRIRDYGYGVGVLQSSAAGYRVYQRLGFEEFGVVPVYVRMPG